MRVPESFTYQIVKRFHAASSRIMVATPSLEAELKHRGFTSPMARWSRGVDLSLFHPRPKYDLGWPRPYLLNVGRVSHEKGLEDFLRIDTPGTKIIVGDGPAKAALERKYPQAKFLGAKKGEELAKAYANADLFVFPSKTDTFGIVLIEALASGLPVAAYPVTGPVDIITDPRIGALNDDLTTAIDHALKNGDPAACPGFGQSYTWERSTEQFLANLVPVKG
jgi:glycosyltransferase involved in cell wall biosynthesis